jgi:galactonate dehydratase
VRPARHLPQILDLDGYSYLLPETPGLGVSFDEQAARTHEFSFWEPPHYRRRDGAYTNW